MVLALARGGDLDGAIARDSDSCTVRTRSSLASLYTPMAGYAATA